MYNMHPQSGVGTRSTTPTSRQNKQRTGKTLRTKASYQSMLNSYREQCGPVTTRLATTEDRIRHNRLTVAQ